MSSFARRRFLAAASAAALFGARGQAFGQEDDATRNSEWITPETQRALDRGLNWLAKRQVTSGKNKGAFGHGGYQGGVAVASLSGLAFMCSGSPPGQGPFGRNIDHAAEFVSGCVQDSPWPNVGNAREVANIGVKLGQPGDAFLTDDAAIVAFHRLTQAGRRLPAKDDQEEDEDQQ